MTDDVDAFACFGKGDPPQASQKDTTHIDGLRRVTVKDLESPLVEYDMNHPRRGDCLLINMKSFDRNATGQSSRDGTDADANNAERTFKALNFKVHRFQDLKMVEMRDVFQNFAKKDHSDADCLVVIILSHGVDDYVFAYDGKIKVDSLTQFFKGNRCTSLLGKPKLFFIQACRGNKFDAGAHLQHDGVNPNEVIEVRKIPVEADFLIGYSTTPGYFAWRNNQDGSWFMQMLCQVLESYAETTEIMHIMTAMHRLVAYKYESCTDREFSNQMKQMPSSVTMLTKLLYFRRK